VKTETTDMIAIVGIGAPADDRGVKLRGVPGRGEVYFDATCPLCLSLLARFGERFRGAGFTFVPLDTPGVAEAQGVSEAGLGRTMHLRPKGGGVVTGVEAWRELFRAVPWMRALAGLLGWPGINGLARAGYRWLATNRRCLSGVCGLPKGLAVHQPHRATTFLELP
jgi:predicted DCC family thiol-disulfide oxidoreductase YuxK